MVLLLPTENAKRQNISPPLHLKSRTFESQIEHESLNLPIAKRPEYHWVFKKKTM